VDAPSRYGIAFMGVTAVGRASARRPQYFCLATRIMAELGTHLVKCYYTDTEFDTTTSCSPGFSAVSTLCPDMFTESHQNPPKPAKTRQS
jgi:DhnA family fructose-bisphosphate aldolase class Ia